MNLFDTPAKADVAKQSRIKDWVRQWLKLPDDVVVMVTELQCTEPGCPPLHTVIAVMHGPGSSQRYKLHKPIADVTSADMTALL